MKTQPASFNYNFRFHFFMTEPSLIAEGKFEFISVKLCVF